MRSDHAAVLSAVDETMGDLARYADGGTHRCFASDATVGRLAAERLGKPKPLHHSTVHRAQQELAAAGKWERDDEYRLADGRKPRTCVWRRPLGVTRIHPCAS